ARRSRIVVHDAHYAVMGCGVSSGYREFKVSDGYQDDVLAVVFNSFGAECERSRALKHAHTLSDDSPLTEEGKAFATFYIDDMLFAVASETALEAFPAANMSPVSLGGRRERIGLISQKRHEQDSAYVWVFDLGYLMRGTPSPISSGSQVIILRDDGKDIGVLVDELHAVPRFSTSKIKPTPF